MRRLCMIGLAVACGPPSPSPSPTTTVSALTACEGLGEPAVSVGRGGLAGFEAWEDGASVLIENNGRYGFTLELLTDGIDTTANVTVLVRYTIGEDTTTEDVAASLALQCPQEGPGWAGVFVPLDDTLQDAAAVSGLDGALVDLTALVTDQTGDTAQTDAALVFEAL